MYSFSIALHSTGYHIQVIDIRSYNKDSTPYLFQAKQTLAVGVQPVPYTKVNSPTKTQNVSISSLISGGSRISHRGGGHGPRTGGHGPPRWLRFENFACQNERILTRKGGAPGAPPPLDPPMLMLNRSD